MAARVFALCVSRLCFHPYLYAAAVDGIINVTLLFGATRDRGQNPSLPTWLSFEYDDTYPRVDLATDVVYPTNLTRIRYRATFTGTLTVAVGTCACMLRDPPSRMSRGVTAERFVNFLNTSITVSDGTSAIVRVDTAAIRYEHRRCWWTLLLLLSS